MDTVLVIGELGFHPGHLIACRAIVDELLAVTKAKRPTTVVILGNVLLSRQKVDVTCMNIAVDFFHELGKICNDVIIVASHLDSTPDGESWMKCCAFIPNVTIITRPVVVNDNLYIPSLSLYSMSETTTSDFIEVLQGFQLDEIKFTFCNHIFNPSQGDVEQLENVSIISGGGGNGKGRTCCSPGLYYTGPCMYASQFDERTVLYIDDRNIISVIHIDAPRIIRRVANINDFDIYDAYEKRACDKIEFSIHGTVKEISALQFPKIKDVSFSFVITDVREDVREEDDDSGVDAFMDILSKLVHESSPHTLTEFNKFFV
jgi:hypothetical protein